MTWWVLAALVAAALTLAGGGFLWWRGRAGRIESPEDAATAAEAMLPGFRTAGAVVGSDGAAALVVGEAGRVAVCRRRGARITAREVVWRDVRATGAGLLVDTGERRFGAVTVAGVDALDVKRMVPSPTRG